MKNWRRKTKEQNNHSLPVSKSSNIDLTVKNKKSKCKYLPMIFCYFHMNMTVKVSENPPGRSYYGFYSGLTLLGDSCTLWCVKTIHWGTIRPQSITASSAASKKTATILPVNGGLTLKIVFLILYCYFCLVNHL